MKKFQPMEKTCKLYEIIKGLPIRNQELKKNCLYELQMMLTNPKYARKVFFDSSKTDLSTAFIWCYTATVDRSTWLELYNLIGAYEKRLHEEKAKGNNAKET